MNKDQQARHHTRGEVEAGVAVIPQLHPTVKFIVVKTKGDDSRIIAITGLDSADDRHISVANAAVIAEMWNVHHKVEVIRTAANSKLIIEG